MCKKIHARTFEERVEVTYNDVDQPIGPTKKVVSDLSLFLGTLARNSTFCPLKYTNWSGMPEKNKNHVWRYANVCGCIYEFECIIIIVFNLLILCSLILFFSGSLSCRLKHEIGLRLLLEMHGEDISTRLSSIIF